jgi:exopolysaccharide biosynthesis polyprenyl glycosylphosphotransferase
MAVISATPTRTEQSSALTSLSPGRALKLVPIAALGLDALMIATVSVLAAFLHPIVPIFDAGEDLGHSMALPGVLIGLGWLLAMSIIGGYEAGVFGAGPDEFKRVFRGSLIAVGAVAMFSYFIHYDTSRGYVGLAFLIGIPALMGGRLALRSSLKRARRHGVLRHRVMIVGDVEHIDDVARVLQRETWIGYEVVGALTPTREASETPYGVPVLGRSSDAAEIFVDSGADLIVVAGGAMCSAAEMQELVYELEKHDGEVVLAPHVTDISQQRIRMRPVGGLPLIHIDKPRAAGATRLAKRAFDVAGASAIILALSPLMLFAALRIKLHDGGPVMFRQTRVGRDGETFGCFKFRTMVVDAESKVAELQKAMGAGALLFKMQDDPRITRPGKWMRRFSVDELPQLFNVFKGDMSLIGPRPQVPAEVAMYSGHMDRRLRVRPGMTGLWQVSGRSSLTVEEAIRLDLYYVDNWSMLQDLAILWRTLGAVVGSKGAY